MKLRPLFLAASVLAALPLVESDAAAQSTDTTYDVISSYKTSGTSYIYVTGVVHGASASTTVQYWASEDPVFESCQRMLLVMLNRPGRFHMTFNIGSTLDECTLAAVP
jgi:hypothetical protein